jgi:NAD(P)-dependent dehydrogenase (short-subunit alcohol dehydrogenase family)
MTITRRCLVVGSSDGIGLALTRALIADGWFIAGVSRSPKPSGDDEPSEACEHVVLDVRIPDFRSRPRTLVERLGPRPTSSRPPRAERSNLHFSTPDRRQCARWRRRDGRVGAHHAMGS